MTELFHDWLGKLTADARVAVTIDSVRFLSEARVLVIFDFRS